MNRTFSRLASIVCSSVWAPGPGGAPGVYVSPLTNSTSSLGTKTRTVVVACWVCSGRTTTGRTGSGSVTDAPGVFGTPRMFAVAFERSRRSGSRREPRSAKTRRNSGTASAPTTAVAPSATNGRMPPAWSAWWWLAVTKRVGFCRWSARVERGNEADRLAREVRPDVADERLAPEVVQRALDDDDPVRLLDDHRVVRAARDERAARRHRHRHDAVGGTVLGEAELRERHQPLGHARAAGGERG